MSKLRISSKLLSSGKCQVKYSYYSDSDKQLYGYLLEDRGTTLKDVVKKIEYHVKGLSNPDHFFHGHLYNLSKTNTPHRPVLIFNQES